MIRVLVALLACALLNQLLKTLVCRTFDLKHNGEMARPRRKDACGMPSGHAQCAAFLVVWIARVWALRCGHVPALVQIGLVLSVLCVMHQRVADGWHTVPQVVAGALLGAGLAWITVDLFLANQWLRLGKK